MHFHFASLIAATLQFLSHASAENYITVRDVTGDPYPARVRRYEFSIDVLTTEVSTFCQKFKENVRYLCTDNQAWDLEVQLKSTVFDEARCDIQIPEGYIEIENGLPLRYPAIGVFYTLKTCGSDAISKAVAMTNGIYALVTNPLPTMTKAKGASAADCRICRGTREEDKQLIYLTHTNDMVRHYSHDVCIHRYFSHRAGQSSTTSCPFDSYGELL